MSTSTAIVNGALIYVLAFCALLFFLIVFLMVFFLVRFRKSRNPIPQELKASPLLEVVWIVVPTLLVTTMFIYGLTSFQFLRNMPSDSIHVKVFARQWSWLFQYDNGKKSSDLVVPLGKNVTCELISQDVIHGFYIPAFRIQQDVVPGLTTKVWFNVTTPGSSYILCSQYCGLKHSAMMAKVIPVAPDQFMAWLNGKKIQLEGNPYSDMPPGEALLYERGCVSCHSISGAKMVGPTLKGIMGTTVIVMTNGQNRSITVDSAYIRESIIHPSQDVLDGYPNTMPPSRDMLSDEEIGYVSTYLKSLK